MPPHRTTARSRASGPMAEAVGHSTSLMTEPDLRAIAVFPKDQPAAAPAPPPALAGRPVVQQPGPNTPPRLVAGGLRAVAAEGAPTGPGMPAFGRRLDDPQVADVATTIRNSRGNRAPAATPADAARLRGMLAAAPR